MLGEQLLDSQAATLLRELLIVGSNFGQQLDQVKAIPLGKLLGTLVDTKDLPLTGQHRMLVAEALNRDLKRRGDPFADDAASFLIHNPVIQQADHSNIILDEETFLNNWLHYLGCRIAGQEYMLVSQCSTVCCLSRRQPVGGPVFLYTRNRLVQVFTHSKRFLKNTHFCLLPGPLQLEFSDQSIGSLFGDVLDRSFHSAPEAYRAANAHLWEELQLEKSIHRIATDERMTSELLALHLERGGPISRLLFDRKVRDAFLKIKRAYVQTPENLGMNRAAPDFFWIADGTRLHEVNWNGEEPTWRSRQIPLPIPWNPIALTDALRSGKVYGSRLLSYTVRCLLPGVIALGGSIQQDYVQAYRQILLNTDKEQPFLEDEEREAISWLGVSRLIGRPLVEPDDEMRSELQKLGPKTNLRELESSLLDKPVGLTIGSLSAVSFYKEIINKAKQRL